jgi:hypothetical protein
MSNNYFWSAVGSNGSGDGAINNGVEAVAVSGSDLYVAGSFTDVAGLPTADYIAKWDGGGWSALGSNGGGNGAISQPVRALAISGDDVYVGTADSVAKWDGSTWSTLGSSFGPLGVSDLAVSGSDVYVGGNFTDADGIATADYVVKWNGSVWSALGSNGAGNGALSGRVNALALSEGDLYVGGVFSDAGGIPAADNVAKWDGSTWSALGSNGAGDGAIQTGEGPLSGLLYALAVSGSDLYVGGGFSDVAGNASADSVAKWDGSTWSALGSNGGDGAIKGTLIALAVSGNDLFVGGGFSNGAGIASADSVAQWDGSSWSAVGSNGNGDGAITSGSGALAVSGSDLYVGGYFTDAAGKPEADRIARATLDNDYPTSSVTGLAQSQATASFAVSWSGIDAGSGIANYIVHTRDEGATAPGALGTPGTWTLWQYEAPATSATFTGAQGHRYCFVSYARDNAGNQETFRQDPDTCSRIVDTSPPSAPSISVNDAAPYAATRAVTLALSATDNAVLTEMQVSDSSTFSGASWQPYAGSLPWTLSDVDGTKTVFARFRDADLNVSATASDDITLDRVVPTSSVTALAASQSTTSFTVAWTGADATSGIDTYDVQVRDDGITPPGGSGTPGSWADLLAATALDHTTFTGSQAHRYCFRSRARDNAGNLESYSSSPDSCTRIADTVAPTGPSVVIGGGPFTNATSVDLTLDATDNGILTEMQLAPTASFAGAVWESFAANRTWTLMAGDGAKPIYARFRDADGNVSAGVSDAVTVDTVVPTGTLTINRGALASTATNVWLALAGVDNVAGIGRYRLSNDGTTWSTWIPSGATAATTWTVTTGDGTKTVYAQFEDLASNVSLAATDAIDLDTTVASDDYGISIDRGAVFTNSTSVVLSMGAPSGTSEMQLSNDGGFAGAVWEPFATARAWTINSVGSAVISDSVYVKFRDETGAPVAGRVSDDIVLDPNPPTAGGGAAPIPDGTRLVQTLRVDTRAVDDRSGVVAMMLSNSADFAGATWEPYATTRRWPIETRAATKLYLRFRDAAGNVSQAYKRVLSRPAAVAVPTQVAPVHLLTTTTTSPTFRWTTVPGGARYQLQVSTASTFARPISARVVGTTYRFPASLARRTVYFWRVRAVGDRWSPAWRFGTPQRTRRRC